jgi:hypothetical protein
MHPVDPERFEEILGARLRQLPMPRAPRTLLPRVMAAAQQWARRPWYARAWFTWPLGWQVASIAVFCVIGAGAVMAVPTVESAAARITSAYIASTGGDVVGAGGRLEATMNAVVILWRAIVKPIAPYVFAFAALMGGACAVFAAALNHVAFGRTVQP